MKKAKITNKDGYKCAPAGHTVVTIPFGTVVEGKVAEWALADKAAKAMFAKGGLENKAVKPKENK